MVCYFEECLAAFVDAESKIPLLFLLLIDYIYVHSYFDLFGKTAMCRLLCIITTIVGRKINYLGTIPFSSVQS